MQPVINSILVAQHGLIVAGDNGQVWTYNSSSNPDTPFTLCKVTGEPRDKKAVPPHMSVSSLALSPNEDVLYYVTTSNQLMKMQISLDGGPNDQQSPAEPVHSFFHQSCITGMDVCLRKQLIVTTSQRHIYIWNYATKTLEIQYKCQMSEEACAVAFHPSGFHIVVAF